MKALAVVKGPQYIQTQPVSLIGMSGVYARFLRYERSVPKPR